MTALDASLFLKLLFVTAEKGKAARRKALWFSQSGAHWD